MIKRFLLFFSFIFSFFICSILSRAQNVRCESQFYRKNLSTHNEEILPFPSHILDSNPITGKLEIQRMIHSFPRSLISSESTQPLEAQLFYYVSDEAHEISILLFKKKVSFILESLSFDFKLKDLVGKYVYNQQKPNAYLYQYEFMSDTYSAVVILSYNLFVGVNGSPLFRVSINLNHKNSDSDSDRNGVELTFTHEDRLGL